VAWAPGCAGTTNTTRTSLQKKLRALAEPRRLAILGVLQAGEMRAGDIAGHFKLTRPAISQHLRALVEAKLVSERREGTSRLYRIRTEGFEDLRGFVDQFWNDRLTSLKFAVEDEAVRRRRGR
jgi:DNA-binding transcriptional ArsR family regulator